MTKTLTSSLITLVLGSAALASHPIDSTKVFTLSISNKGITRLSVEGDQIQDVFVSPNDLQNNLQLHKSGHVFIAAEGVDKPLYLTVMTRKGETQDLKITFTDKAPCPVLLKSKKKMVRLKEGDIEVWMDEILRGLTPVGFRRVIPNQQQRTTEDLVADPVEAYINDHCEITKFSVRTKGDIPIQLDPSVISRTGEAVTYSHTILKPGDVGTLITLTKQEEITR